MRSTDTAPLRVTTPTLKWLLIGAVVAIIWDVLFGVLVGLLLTSASSGQLPPRVGIAIQILLVLASSLAAVLILRQRSLKAVVISPLAVMAGYLAGSVHLAALVFAVVVAIAGTNSERRPDLTNLVSPPPEA
jgi:hypothetical protein